MSFWYQNGVCSNNRYSHRRTKIRVRHGVGALLTLFGVGAIAQAQDTQPAGLVARFDVSQRFEYSDNPDLDVDGTSDFFGRTTLGFGLDSTTGIQKFTFNLGTDILEGRSDRPSLDVANPYASLRYDRATESARFGFGAVYRESDVTSSFFDEDFPIDSGIINQDTGTRQIFAYDLTGAVGLQAPVGASFRYAYSEVRYSGTSDPDLRDQSIDDLSAQINFRIDPRITARLTAEYYNYDVVGPGVDRRTTGIGAGVTLDVTPTLQADVSLSQDKIEQSGDINQTDEGLSGTVALTQTLTNGTLGVALSSDLTSVGRREYLTFSRSMDLVRGQKLSFSLGATRRDGVGTNPTFGANYSYELPTGLFSFGVTQSVTADSDNQEQINTALRASYDHRINNTSSLGASIGFWDRNELGAAADDGQRYDISLTYRHELTRDWGLVGGVSHIFSSSDFEADRSSNTVFVGIQRSFSWNP